MAFVIGRTGWGFEPISMQQPGGLLRPPVQKLAATILFACGEKAIESLIRKTYITISRTTMMVMLITMEMELMALDNPASQPSCLVNTGVAEPMGLKARITSV